MLEKGHFYERVAQKYIIEKNLDIICTNFHSRFGEIDIIAKDKEYLIFFEVRMRKDNSLVSPAESVDKKKQKKIVKTALEFISTHRMDLQPRFDVLEIKECEGRVYINHIQNAFSSDEYI